MILTLDYKYQRYRQLLCEILIGQLADYFKANTIEIQVQIVKAGKQDQSSKKIKRGKKKLYKFTENFV